VDKSQAREDQQALPKVLLPWIQVATGVLALGAALWAVVQFFNPVRALDLTVLVKSVVPIEIPEEPEAVPLSLHFDGKPIRSATLIDCQIRNSGSKPIGAESQHWVLKLEGDEGTRAVAVGALSTDPNGLTVRLLDESEVDRSVSLEFGLLNPGDTVSIQLAIINRPKLGSRLLSASTRIPGLSEPVVTRRETHERIQDALEDPIFFMLIIVAAPACLRIFHRMRHWNSLIGQIGQYVIATVCAVMLSAPVAIGASWLLAKIIERTLAV
jgi:hypothetical protein